MQGPLRAPKTVRAGSRRLFGLALLIGAAMAAGGAQAGEAPVVVELFTSQGCSSCPPADSYLGELSGRRDVIPLAFHVDYWNYIGWIDPYASKQMTQRQKDYARVLRQHYLYTPEMVVNGAEHEVGSDRHGVEKLIAAAKAAALPGPPIAIRRDPAGPIHVSIGAGGARAEEATVWFVGFEREHATAVDRGENEGRTLTDYQIVRSLRAVATYKGEAIELALDPDKDGPADGGYAVLVQHGGVGPIIGAAMLRFDPGG